MTDLPALNESHLPAAASGGTPLRFALLYGSVRAKSFSHLLVEEAARLIEHLGGEARIFDPAGLPMPGGPPGDDPKVAGLHELMRWSDAQIWCSPENYGTVSAVLKAQLDSCPPPLFAGKPLATMQVCGAGPNMGTTTALATIGRWLNMIVTPGLYCVPQVQTQFDEDGRMKPSPHYDKLVDLVEELVKITAALHDSRDALIDRYSARKAG